MIGLLLFVLLVLIAVISMFAISMKVENSLRNQNYISGVRYGKVVQQLQDKHELHRFGFAQYFRRQYGEVSIFSLSMNAIGIFPMLLLLLSPILMRGGLTTSLYIYCGVGFVFIFIVALIAQYLSSQPTAGGIYHVALRKGGVWLGAMIGGFQLFAQLGMLIGYSVGFVYFLTLLVPGIGALLHSSVAYIAAVGAVIIIQGCISWLKSSYYPLLHNIAMLLQASGAVLLVIAIFLVLRGDGYNGMHLFYSHTSAEGWFPPTDSLEASGIGVMVALMCRLFIGGDASSQAAEETIEPKVRVSWSTLLSTCYSYIIGLILLLLLAIVYMNFGLQSATGDGGQWLIMLTEQSSRIGSALIIIAMVSCWLSCSTMLQVGARTIMAMARDGILPMKSLLSQMSYAKQAPQHAMLGMQCAALLLLLLLTGSTGTELILMTSLLTIISYAIMCVLLFYFVPLEPRKALWRLEEWSKPLRYISMIVLVGVATAAASMLSLYQLLLIFIPVLLLLIYASIKHGIAARLLLYDGSSQRDLFEVEGRIPLQ